MHVAIVEKGESQDNETCHHHVVDCSEIVDLKHN